MNEQLTRDPILQRFRAALADVYGDRLERAVLFGSRARGDNRPDSDYDIAVFLRDFTTRWDELLHISRVTTDILVDTGAVISAKPYQSEAYRADKPLMLEIVRDGLDL